MMSIWLADVNGRVVKAIVNKDLKMFIYRIFVLFLFALPSSTVNSAISFFERRLDLALRLRLTVHFHKHYLKNMHYYKICNLDNRIGNPDQRLTNDTEKWAGSLSTWYLNTAKPILDIIFFSRKLASVMGWQGPALTLAWYGFATLIIKKISPSFGKLTAEEQKLEGEYRGNHTELLAHSEEVAFFRGQEWEHR